jgi:signal transduction histidine kinase/DNA-binding response OmpR family regulator
MVRQNEKILVVDSDPEVIDLVAQQVLVPQGYQVATALDGSNALQKALKLAPDIIITALELPGLSGRDLLAALRTQGFQAIVIATGPKGSETHALQALRLGAKDYLTKPIREAELVASLDHALEELRLRREREQLAQKLSVANQQLEKRVKELTTLYSIGKAVTAVTDLSQLFDRLIEGALFVTEGEIGWLLLADEGSGKLILRGAKNLPSLSGIKLHQPWDDGLSSLLMLSGEGITIAGEPLAKMRAGQVVRAAAAVPVKAKDQVMGVIAVGNKSGRPFTERDQAMLSAVADYASIALVNARLFQALEARARSLQKEFETLAQGGQQKEAMVMRLARELRTPLLQARNALDDVVRGKTGPLNPHQTGLAQAALERLDAAQRLVEDMNILGDTTDRPPNPRPVILADIARQSLARMGVEARQSGVALVAEFPSEPLRVAADAAQIGRVFENLLANAIKFSPHGGQVSVRLRDAGNGNVEVAIADQGLGIPSDKLSRIWDKYFQVDEAGARKHGVGLGLSVVKQVVEALGGKVWVESQLGKGSTFHFSLVKL